jgi:hypothetical protein
MFRKAAAAVNPAIADPLNGAIVTKDVSPEPDAIKSQTASPKTLRAGSKAAALVALLQGTEGASLDEMIERTGWQGHTVRAAMTGLRKKGHVIDKRISGNSTVWFIAAGTGA